MAVIDTLKDKNGIEQYPRTVTTAVYDSTTNERLDNILIHCVKTALEN